MIAFDNSYARLPESFYAQVAPEPAVRPELLAWNQALADQLGLSTLAEDPAALARMFGGAEVIPGSQPIAQAYAGHQFGGFTPQLGDGRAVLLGELVDADGARFDLQLKGSGRTPFSRGGDGRSWLGPVIREYILSEAMHRLGVPTTRALAAVATGETVYREEPLPGAVFTRVAASHLRVGTYQYFAARKEVAALQTLADYAIDRHYPQARAEESRYLAFFRAVMNRQADLIAHWMAVGFIHGVMNTDNTTISGETIDYGPAAYLDEFSFNKTFSSIDQQGRYAYANQPAIGQWNLARLAETLLLLKVPLEALEEALGEYPEIYQQRYLEKMRPKLGLSDAQAEDAELISDWLTHLEEGGLDYTLSFRALADRAGQAGEPEFGEVELRWRKRLGTQAARQARTLMNSVNPLFIPRNHRVEQAIERAVEGDLSVFEDLNTVLTEPFTKQPEFAEYAEPPEPHERVTRTFCGT
jgi:uncharacterized protein YdiU (UPF0061 family)